MRDAELLRRQHKLVLRSQQLRASLARDAATLARPLDAVAATGTVLARFASGPGLPVAALYSLALAWRLRRGLRTALRLWGIWQGWCSLSHWLRN